MHAQIKASLIALHEGIKSSHADTLRREMAFLDQVVREQKGQIHPQLAHFLMNRSYAKALLFVEGANDIPAGICGGRARREDTP